MDVLEHWSLNRRPLSSPFKLPRMSPGLIWHRETRSVTTHQECGQRKRSILDLHSFLCLMSARRDTAEKVVDRSLHCHLFRVSAGSMKKLSEVQIRSSALPVRGDLSAKRWTFRCITQLTGTIIIGKLRRATQIEWVTHPFVHSKSLTEPHPYACSHVPRMTNDNERKAPPIFTPAETRVGGVTAQSSPTIVNPDTAFLV